MTRTDIVILVACIDAVITLIAPVLNLTIDGELIFATIETSAPGLFGALEWAWSTGEFLINLAFFNIDQIPAAVSMIFVLINILMAWILVTLIRGTEG